MKKSIWIIYLVFLGLSSGAQAAPVYFFNDIVTDRAAFQAAVSGPLLLESFEDPFTAGPVQQFTAGGNANITVTSDTTLSRETALPARFITDGSASLRTPEGNTTAVSFSFATPIFAFGIDVLDLNFTNMSFADDLGNTLPNVLLKDDCGPAGGVSCVNLQFFGVINDKAFSQVDLTFVQSTGGTMFFDRLEFSPVPLPAGIWLFSAAILGLIGITRKKVARTN